MITVNINQYNDKHMINIWMSVVNLIVSDGFY